MKTYWYKNNKYPNLGDDFVGILLQKKYGVTAQWSKFPQAELIGTGSILGSPWVGLDKGRTKTLHIVGSGLMSPATRLMPKENLRIHSVRGFLSKEKLGPMDSDRVRIGDPGLLIRDIASSEGQPDGFVAQQARIGVILHHTNSTNEELKSRFSHLPVKFIDIRTENIDKFAAEMLACDLILSESLHGLIFADSLGIPNAWMTLKPIHMGGFFKFYDYFSSIGRPFYLRVNGIPRSLREVEQNMAVPNGSRVAQLLTEIDNSFQQAFNAIKIDRQTPIVFSEGNGAVGHEIEIPVKINSSAFRVDFTAELDKNINYRDLLTSLTLNDKDGNQVKGARKIPGLSWSNSSRVDHYRYTNVVPGRWTYSEYFSLPEGIQCLNVKLMRWANPDRTVNIQSVAIREIS